MFTFYIATFNMVDDLQRLDNTTAFNIYIRTLRYDGVLNVTLMISSVRKVHHGSIRIRYRPDGFTGS